MWGFCLSGGDGGERGGFVGDDRIGIYEGKGLGWGGGG